MPLPLIAIDGPAAVGKSSVGILLARRLGYRFVDTGAMYRALTWKALQSDIDPDDGKGLAYLVETTDIDILPAMDTKQGYRVMVDGEDVSSKIRSKNVEASVSRISSMPQVRHGMVYMQQKISQGENVIVAGRDIATIVLPQADLKVFLTASPEERASRRYRQLTTSEQQAEYGTVLSDLNARDNTDSNREISPLRPDSESKVIDTDKMTLEQVADHIYALAQNL